MMAEAEDRDPLWLKREAITALFPYAVWEERTNCLAPVEELAVIFTFSHLFEFPSY